MNDIRRLEDETKEELDEVCIIKSHVLVLFCFSQIIYRI